MGKRVLVTGAATGFGRGVAFGGGQQGGQLDVGQIGHAQSCDRFTGAPWAAASAMRHR